MKKVFYFMLAFLTVSFCEAQKIKELAGTYIVSEKYRDTVKYFSHNDTMVLKNQLEKDFSKFKGNAKAFLEVNSLYKRMDGNYRKTKLTLFIDSTFKLISPEDTINGKFKILPDIKNIYLSTDKKLSPAFDRKTLKLEYKKEGKKIKLISISKNRLIYSKE